MTLSNRNAIILFALDLTENVNVVYAQIVKKFHLTTRFKIDEDFGKDILEIN